MRIGIDARVLQGERRGHWRYLYCLINGLLKVDRVNDYVLYYNGFSSGPFIFPEQGNLRQLWCHVPGRVLKPLWSAYGWPPVEYLIKQKIDIFHNPVNYNRTFFTPIPTNKPMVVTYHGISAPQILFESFGYTVEETMRWLKLIQQSADRVILISNLVKQNLLEYINIPEEKLRVVYSGVEDSFKPVEDKEAQNGALARYGLDNKRYFLYLGGMEKNKNLERLLQAFSSLAEGRDVYLVLAGQVSVARKEELRKIYDKQVLYPGPVEAGDLCALYSGASAFVLPTIFEGFGLPVLEAMACGVPVVCSRATGVMEQVGDAAIQFNPEDSAELGRWLRSILDDSQLCARLRKAGLEKARQMSWDKTARDTINVYEELK
jgi:glycosyltransferase involved in cell wall biosynthesis